jgi:lysophospholipase L1-like esterase
MIVLAAFLFTGCGPTDPTTPVHRLGDRQWAARHGELLQRRDAEVVFLGDSITHFWEYDGREVWETFADRKPGNFGIAGDQTGHVLWRITAGKELDGLRPRLCVLLIGTNNLGAGQRPEKVADGVAAIVAELKRRDVKVLLLGIFPRATGADAVRETNERLAGLADGERVVFRDIGERLPASVMPDGLHLNAEGYRIWAEAIRADLTTATRAPPAGRGGGSPPPRRSSESAGG